MIPLRDNVPTRRFPLVCVCLIIINVLVFILDQMQLTVVTYASGAQEVQQAVGGLSLRYAMIPAYITGNIQSPPLTPLFVHPAWLTIFTAMFLHANWLHVGGNMLYLWIFGNNIEDVLGRGRFVLFYLASGVGAAALQIASDPASPIPSIGASGAVAGVMGAYILLYPGAKVLSIVPIVIGIVMEVPALIVIGVWFLLQVFNARMLGSGGMLSHEGGVAYMAHVGGFVTGMLLILLMGGRKLLPPAQEPIPKWLRDRLPVPDNRYDPTPYDRDRQDRDR
jgi:membrane associated rhomboid family serine protease